MRNHPAILDAKEKPFNGTLALANGKGRASLEQKKFLAFMHFIHSTAQSSLNLVQVTAPDCTLNNLNKDRRPQVWLLRQRWGFIQ